MDVDSSSDDSSSDNDSSSSNDMETGIERHVRELENDDARVAAAAVEAFQAENESLEAENESLQAENESLTSRLEAKCVVCFERAPDVVFMPCFHAVSCSNCGLREEVDTCPVCRVPIEQKHRIYVS